ncbi:hypothetical protein MMC07_005761 [Pseudocyphellaria aurata]|nr:hypothetical protein [Pseudocyphellaria aurata]
MAESKPPPGHFQTIYFASAAAFTKKASDHFPAPFPASDLFRLLESKYPGINERVLCSCAVTLNLDYVDMVEGSASQPGFGGEAGKDQPLATLIIKEGDEVAIIPPVSSG